MKTLTSLDSAHPPSTTLRLLVAAILALAWTAQAVSTIEITTTRYSVDEDAGEAVGKVGRSDDVDTAVSVRYSTADGTAAAGVDYVAVSGLLEFEAGETEQQIRIPLINDGEIETAESFTLTLSEPGPGAVVGTRFELAVRINDNDTGFRLEYAAYQAQEDEGSVLVAILRGNDGATACSVDYSTTDVKANGGSDYSAQSGTLVFAPEDGMLFVTIPVLNDGTKESSETFTLTLSNPSEGAAISSQGNTTTVTIIDNDTGAHWVMPDPWSGGYWVAEEEGAVTLRAHRGRDGDLAPCTIDYATVGGTAVGGEDFVASSGTISFAEGEITKAVTILVLEDEEAESTENFRLQLSNPSPGMVYVPRNATMTVNILDSTGHSGHIVESVSFEPSVGCTLALSSSLSAQYADMFDVFWVDASESMNDWERTGFVARRNSSSSPVSYVDEAGTEHPKCFYRITTGSCIVSVPPVTGPFPVGLIERVVTDNSRRNRYSRSAKAAFPIWIYYPAAPVPGIGSRIYGGEEWVQGRQYHSYGFLNAPTVPGQGPFPIVLFSHGFRADHTQFTDRAEELASHGYVVLSPNHYDSTALISEDGKWLYGENRIDSAGLEDRIRDFQFILDQCVLWNESDDILVGQLDLAHVAVTGFSYGGNTAAELCRREERVDVAILQDAGGPTTSAHNQGIGKPFMQICADNTELTFMNHASEDAFYFRMSGAVHATFDGYYFVDPSASFRAIAEESNLAMRAYMLSFLDHYLKGKDTTLHEGPSEQHPRVINYQKK